MKKCFINLISIMLLAPLYLNTLAQENYQPGYIIKSSGDTVKGFIDYREWDKNPNRINFVQSKGDTATKYIPRTIKEFAVAGTLYRSALVEMEMSPDKVSELNDNPTVILAKDTVFLQVLIDGEKGLCYYLPPVKKEQFYTAYDGQYDLLIYKRYYSRNTNASQTASRVISYNKKYVGQLSLFLTNCPDVQKKLNYVNYKRRDLQKIFDSYYTCTHLEKAYELQPEKMKVYWSVLAGPSFTFLKFTSNSSDHTWDYMVNGDFKPSVFVAAGVACEVVFRGNQGKWSFNSELIFTSYNSEGHYVSSNNPSSYTKWDTEIGGSYLKLNLMGRYKYPVGKTFIFADAGLTPGILIAYQDNVTREYVFYGPPQIVNLSVFGGKPRRFEMGYIFGAGLRIGHFSGELRYEGGNGMSPYTLLTSRVQRLYFLLGYRF